MRFQKSIFNLLCVFATTSLLSCSGDDDGNNNNQADANIIVNGTVLFEDGDDFNGDIDGDFNGDGGTATRTFFWINSLTTADYNADITATAEGSFNMQVRGADGNTVLDRSLIGDSEPDSFSGVTSAGASGMWSVTISLIAFDGDGSFSLSEGN